MPGPNILKNRVLRDLQTKPNPRGAGTFVFVPRTRVLDVTQRPIWLVVNGTPYALTTASKRLTRR